MNFRSSAALSWIVLLGTVTRLSADEPASYREWKHGGNLTILTSREGAALPASAVVDDFPILVRLHSDFFDFREAKPGGDDIRFSTPDGKPLVYEIESWDAKTGAATLWVRIPRIRGNERQTIRMHWGNPSAAAESNGQAVFNASNGYLAVAHLGERVRDAAGTLDLKDAGTTPTVGVIGQARRFDGKKGIAGGESIAGFPTGSSPHSSETWFRAVKPNGRLIAWGNEKAQGKVVMNFRSPPHISMDCYFSDGNVSSERRLALGEWTHVVHTYDRGRARLYINGTLDGESKGKSAPLNIKSPARFWLGGWYGDFDFVGDLDEVRVSNVARSPEWIRLQFENQKPLQTLVGPLVIPGKHFAISPEKIEVNEGKSVAIQAKADGAQKIYWILKDATGERVVAVDRLGYTFEVGRIVGDRAAVLRIRAVFPDGEKTADVPIAIKEAIPDPEFTLVAPAAWNGRDRIEIAARFSNLEDETVKNFGTLKTEWSIAPLAVSKIQTTDKLVLTRAQNSGKLTVTAAISNGGAPVTRTATIDVTEPERDPWIARTPGPDEQPEDGQFYAREDDGEGTLHYNGKLDQPAESAILKLYADGQLIRTESQKLSDDRSYRFAVKLKAGLVKYKVEFSTVTAGRERILRNVDNLVCGDAFLIAGQSNAVATDFGKDDPKFQSEWIRTFGSMSSSPKGIRIWGEARHRSRDADKLQIGYWGMELARQLVEKHKVPICILNGAVGGTRIDQHQRNPEDPEDGTTIYGRLLWRARQAKLTHGIRGILWHQGENDQGADGPTGGYGWETYRQYFIDLAAAWKHDYPNVQRYYVFQIWPQACAMGINGSDNRLREVQRTLPTAFSNLDVMSTLGIQPPGGCHFPAAGYAEFAQLILPLVERNHYGMKFSSPITPPNLRSARFATNASDEIMLEFDQPVKWNNALAGEFYIDGESGKIASGTSAGNSLTLKLVRPMPAARQITYLDSKSWAQSRLLSGKNGLAALTFCEVPIQGKSAR
jgi:hypothetical protein